MGQVVRTVPGNSKSSVTVSYFLPKLEDFLFFLIYFLAALGLHCCVWASSSCGERGLLFFAVHVLLTVVASLAAEHGL